MLFRRFSGSETVVEYISINLVNTHSAVPPIHSELEVSVVFAASVLFQIEWYASSYTPARNDFLILILIA